MRRTILMRLAPLVAACSTLAAQRPVDLVDRRFRFAESFVGVDAQLQPAGSLGAREIGVATVPRVSIGGLHFWGHADFAITLPVARPAHAGVQRSTGIETRARLYPWPVQRNTIRPFIGGGLAAVDLAVSTDAGDGPRLYAPRAMVQAGATLRRGSLLFDAGWSWRPSTAVQYPTSRTTREIATLPGNAFWIGAHRTFETTALQSGHVRRGGAAKDEAELRAAGRLSGPTLAVGVSSPILTGPTRFNEENRPWLAPRPRGTPMVDIGIGWYADALDAHANLAWRRARFETEGFGYTQQRTRRSFAVESYKFLGDYHGFVPFLGPVVSAERLAVRERDGGGTVTDVTRSFIAAGIVAGWDIRPTRTEKFLLRTNVRWMPRLRLDAPGGGTHAFDQIEFNFIQLVWFPKR